MDRLTSAEPSPLDRLSTEELMAVALDNYATWSERWSEVRAKLENGDVEGARTLRQELQPLYATGDAAMSRIDPAHRDWVWAQLALTHPGSFGD